MRAFAILLSFALILLAAPAWAAEGDLSRLAAMLVQVRATRGVNELRDAGPELTPVKQALRAWIEHQLPLDPKSTDPRGFVNTVTSEDLALLSARLNQSLDAAGLTCGEDDAPIKRCVSDPTSFENDRGYVGGVRISILDGGRYLLVVTGVGIRCGYDESAYIYRHGPGRSWTLLLATEQNRYGKDEYAPQNFVSIGASPANVAWNDPAPPLPLVVTLGYSPWCSSNWQMLQTRLWRATDANPTPRPLIDRSDLLYIGDYLIAAARLTPTDLLIEYRGGSIDNGTIIRTHVAHYLIQSGDRLERIAPVALSPNDFVDEWVSSAWPEATRWSDPAADPAALAALHAISAATGVSGEFDGPAKRCRSDQTLCQVSFSGNAKDNKADPPPVYYKVRWIAPYRFTLVDGGLHPFPGCNEEVAMPDNVRTLFLLQEWTP